MSQPKLELSWRGPTVLLMALVILGTGSAVLGGSADPESVGVGGGAGPAEPASPDAAAGGGVLISLRLPGSTLKPRENDVSYTVGGSGACTYVTAGDASTVWNHKLTLPQGARVDTLRMYFYDTSGSNSSAWFTIYDLYGSIVQEWSVASSGSSGNSFTDSALIDHTVDYSVYSYAINWRPVVTGSTMQLCGFRIFYVPVEMFSDGFESHDFTAWSAVQP